MAKKKDWREGEIVLAFNLKKITGNPTPTMQEWLKTDILQLTDTEQDNFTNAHQKCVKYLSTWGEEDLKMKFISPILELGKLMEDEKFASFFDKKLAATVQGYALSVKADFVVAKGLMDFMQKPYFHFQEYKPSKNPTGDSMAQILEAFLIAQVINDDGKPLYGCEVIGGIWTFITMEKDSYCVSEIFDSRRKDDLLQIIAILRKFRHILETKLL